MFVLIVYDVSEERVLKVNKYLKTYLHWIQNSVFQGEITPAQLKIIKSGLKDIVDTNYDAIYFFIVRNPHHIKKEIMGVERGDTSNII